MARKNPLRRIVDFVNTLPSWLASPLLSLVFNSKVKLAGTAGLQVVDTDGMSVTFKQANDKHVQNHIGSVHAAAMALLAESASGFIVGINLPDDKLPLIKSMTLNYVKRAKGDMQAKAWLSPEQVELMQTSEKGEVSVSVTVTDSQMIEPVTAEMIWAWVPKKR